jgi:hypothetical protein
MVHLKDIVQAVVIVLIFAALFFISMMSAGLKDLKKKWPEIRCSPTAMPFAGYLGHNPMENFVFCIGKIQSNMMGFFLKPIYYVISLTGSLGGSILKSLNKFRKMFAGLRNMIRNIVGDIFGIFTNILIKFQKLILKLKDLVMKLIGTVVVIIYTLQGAMYTGQSINRGPIGSTLRTICFSPNTILELKNGEKRKMKDIKIGDVLENGTQVQATIKILGNKESPYYKIYSEKLGTNIYVTGQHKIQDKQSGRFIPVSKCSYAVSTNKQADVLSCLITDDHLIPIGEHVFWDWED